MAPKKAPPKATKAKADAPPEQTEDELLGLLAAKELEAARAREKLQQLEADREALGADNFALTTEVDKQRANLRDINDYLTAEVRTKAARICTLESQLAATRQELEVASKKAQDEADRRMQSMKEDVARKRAELAAAQDRLKASDTFLAERDHMQNQMQLLRDESDELKKTHHKAMIELERKHAQERELWKKEQSAAVKQAREEMMALTDNRLDITTKRTILENEQMSGELQYQSWQAGAGPAEIVQNLVQRNEALQKEVGQLKATLEVAKNAEEELVKKNHLCERTIETLLVRLEADDAERGEGGHPSVLLDYQERIAGLEEEVHDAVVQLDDKVEQATQLEEQLKAARMELAEVKGKQRGLAELLAKCLRDTQQQSASTTHCAPEGHPVVSDGQEPQGLHQLAAGQPAEVLQQLLRQLESAAAAGQGAAVLPRSIAAALAAALLTAASAPPAAEAVLALPKGQLPRTAEIALRRSIPAFNREVKDVQDKLEDIAVKLRIPQRKPWSGMAQSLDAAAKAAADQEAMLVGVLPPYRAQAEEMVTDIQQGLDRLSEAVANKDPDRTSLRVASLLRQVADLELLQAPGLPYRVPQQYRDLPRLIGRATVELVIMPAAGEEDSLQQPPATLRIVLDGYSAPLTAGNFVANVLDGVYNNTPLNTTFNSILLPEDQGIPLEMLPLGDFEPQYRAQLDVQSGELPVLPLSINGAVAMAQLPSDPDSSSGSGDFTGVGALGGGTLNGAVSSRQWFIYKFDRFQAGLAGLSFDEGSFGVFGYVTEGADELGKLAGGDVVVEAKVLSGADKLVRPAAS
ncbi:hypothetical protein N2152v2_007934 [Parachlorella kessleri]